jgi:hypothetical protein
MLRAAARKLQDNPRNLKSALDRAAKFQRMFPSMADVISLPLRRRLLPPRLVNDGWWLARHPSADVTPLPVRGRRLCNIIPFPIARRRRKASDD